jgi:hypothetical protein
MFCGDDETMEEIKKNECAAFLLDFSSQNYN